MEQIYRGYQRARIPSSCQQITRLKENSVTISLPQCIANLFDNHFASVSSDENYDEQFTSHKSLIESQPINFDTHESFSLYQQTNYSQRFIKTSGTLLLDQTAFTLLWLKNLHPNALSYFLTLFNAILFQSIYPSQWKLATVLPIPKHSKDRSSPDSYRPIALTSVLGKLFQKLLNLSLIHISEPTRPY